MLEIHMKKNDERRHSFTLFQWLECCGQRCQWDDDRPLYWWHCGPEFSRFRALVVFLVLGCPFWRPCRLTATCMNVPGPHFIFTVMDFLLHFALVSLFIPFIFIPLHHSLNLHAPRLIWCDHHGFQIASFFQKEAKLVVASRSRRCQAGNELVWLSERGTRVLGVDEEFSGSMRDPFETSRRVHDF